MATQHAPEELVERVQDLLGSLDEIDDPAAQAQVQELVGTILELYGTGMERILGVVDDAGDAAPAIRQAMCDDGVIASLLLIHGLYPVPLEERIIEALDSVRPFLKTHGGGVELISVEDGVARLRLEGSCDGCAASAATLENALKEAIDEMAPDLLALEVEGVVGLPMPGEEKSAKFSLPMAKVGSLPMADEGNSQYTECPSGVKA